MIQLLVALAIIVVIYVFLFNGNEAVNKSVKDQPTIQYQQQVEKIKGLEQNLQQEVDKKMQKFDQQYNERK